MSDRDKIDDEASNSENDGTDQVGIENSTNADAEGESQTTKSSDQEPSDVSDSTNESSENSMPAPPPASFSVLVTMLFTQAMGMLGQMPDPNTGEAKVNKPFAKHYIDTLEMLESKTKGNLDEQEAAMLNEALHALRMMYVDTRDT
ncbi:MAG: DUF1844 domain-containing protein [Rubripirellula sp.]|nr:DUF1844 domain-containing protein [Rubripirellula sp.]